MVALAGGGRKSGIVDALGVLLATGVRDRVRESLWGRFHGGLETRVTLGFARFVRFHGASTKIDVPAVAVESAAVGGAVSLFCRFRSAGSGAGVGSGTVPSPPWLSASAAGSRFMALAHAVCLYR